jgi:1,4-dihydroxy-2-naphthoate octaprenyltransferase
MLIFYLVDLYKGCIGQEGVYQSFLGFCHLILWGGIPPLGMLVFGLLTIRNVRQVKRRLRPHENTHVQSQEQQQQRQTHDQLIRMTLIQCLTFGLTSSVYAVDFIYQAIAVVLTTRNTLEQSDNTRRSTMLTSIAVTMPYMSFYICTLSSPLFRRELIRFFRSEKFTIVQTSANVQRSSIRH